MFCLAEVYLCILSSNLLVSRPNACLSRGGQWDWETNRLLENTELHLVTLQGSFSYFHKCDI
jgi:hypothetical protein